MESPSLDFIYKPMIHLVRQIVSKDDYVRHVRTVPQMCDVDSGSHPGDLWLGLHDLLGASQALKDALPLVFAFSTDEFKADLDPIEDARNVRKRPSLCYIIHDCVLTTFDSCIPSMFG